MTRVQSLSQELPIRGGRTQCQVMGALGTLLFPTAPFPWPAALAGPWGQSKSLIFPRPEEGQGCGRACRVEGLVESLLSLSHGRGACVKERQGQAALALTIDSLLPTATNKSTLLKQGTPASPALLHFQALTSQAPGHPRAFARFFGLWDLYLPLQLMVLPNSGHLWPVPTTGPASHCADTDMGTL